MSLSFALAMQQLVEGGKVRRLSWKDESQDIYLELHFENQQVCMFHNGQFEGIIFVKEDLIATDWVVVQ